VFVFDGHFEIPLASALNHLTQSQLQQQAGNMEQALAEAQTAVQLAPDSLRTQAALGLLLMKLNRPEEGRQTLQRALTIAETVKPDLQSPWTVASVKAALGK
jgi:Flp pilus assembly protein TadD